MGEFSVKNLNPRDGFIPVVIAACSSIVAPLVLFTIILSEYSVSLTRHDTQTLVTFVISAMILGGSLTIAAYLYCCYPVGARSRLVLGVVSGALVVAYPLVVLLVGDLGTVVSTLGIRVDPKYVAMIVAYGSVPLLFNAFAEYEVSRRKWLESSRLDEAAVSAK